MVSAHTPQHLPLLITIQGEARGGKGTLTRKLAEDLAKDHAVAVVEQGLKFRVIADEFLKSGGDIEDIEAIGAFVSDPHEREKLLEQLALVAQMDKAALDEQYYSPEINNAAGMVGKSAVAQTVVAELLHDEVQLLGECSDIILLDGRAWTEKAKALEAVGLVRHCLSIDVTCDPMTAARRLTGIFEPVEDLSAHKAQQLLKQVDDINKRNSADRRRKVHPSLPISGAVDFDVTHEHSEADMKKIVEEVVGSRALSVDNSHTRSIEQFTAPVVKLVRLVLARM